MHASFHEGCCDAKGGGEKNAVPSGENAENRVAADLSRVIAVTH